MDFEKISQDLYRLPPRDFTAVRNKRVSEARKKGNTKLADALKSLQKPTIGAWLANLLAHERSEDLERLIRLSGELRKDRDSAHGELVRRVSKEKQDAIANLLEDAISMAARVGQSVSGAAALDLETTLDAAFADSNAAGSVRDGRLTTALRYSGLGFADPGRPHKTAPTPTVKPPSSTLIAAKRELEVAERDARHADAEVEKARHDVAVAEDDLKRLKTEIASALRRARDAHKRAAAANKRVAEGDRRASGSTRA